MPSVKEFRAGVGRASARPPAASLRGTLEPSGLQSGVGSCVWIQFPALGQVPFAADGLFTLPFVEIISDLLLIVSKINTSRLADPPGAGSLFHGALGAIASHLKQPVISSLERGSYNDR